MFDGLVGLLVCRIKRLPLNLMDSFTHGFEAKGGNCEKVMRCLGELLLGELRLGETEVIGREFIRR